MGQAGQLGQAEQAWQVRKGWQGGNCGKRAAAPSGRNFLLVARAQSGASGHVASATENHASNSNHLPHLPFRLNESASPHLAHLMVKSACATSSRHPLPLTRRASGQGGLSGSLQNQTSRQVGQVAEIWEISQRLPNAALQGSALCACHAALFVDRFCSAAVRQIGSPAFRKKRL